MKMLYILNVANRVNNFCMSSLIAAKKTGIEYHIAGNWGYANDAERVADEEKYGIHIYQIDFIRFPLDIRNYKAYKQLKEIVNREKYDVIYCNTPTGGLLGRLAGKKCGVKKVIYQAHGFHFYKGAPKLNWMVYYPIEKWLAHHTDALITINQEDYELAKTKLKLRRNGKVYYVPGVGIDTTQYALSAKAREEKRIELKLAENDVALISMGDLIERKNYDTAIRAIAEANNPALQYFICGKGPEEENLKALAVSLGVSEQIHFLGFRSDIKELLAAVDIFLFTTKQEGLPRSMMDAMASGLPCIASKVRGNTDLLEDGVGGYLCEVDNSTEYANAIKKLVEEPELRKQLGTANSKHILDFDISKISQKMEEIYVAEFKISE